MTTLYSFCAQSGCPDGEFLTEIYVSSIRHETPGRAYRFQRFSNWGEQIPANAQDYDLLIKMSALEQLVNRYQSRHSSIIFHARGVCTRASEITLCYSPASSMVGQTLSHFRILSQIGHGGMGVVFHAEDVRLNRNVAIKILPEQLVSDPDMLERFYREARSASRITHPHICTVYEISEDDRGRPFLVMELLQGETLKRRLERGPVPLAELLNWGIQVSDALGSAHESGIIHRDIKPGNLFITDRGQLKILDFGLARLIAHGDANTPVHDGITRTIAKEFRTNPGQTSGTVTYMSPEQARGEELDQRTDLFSLGVVLFQMATGELPFAGNTTAVIFDAILNREPVPALDLNPALPPEIRRVIRKALEKERGLRYQSATELRLDLELLKRGGNIDGAVTPPPKGGPRARTRATLVIALSAIVVTCAGVGLREFINHNGLRILGSIRSNPLNDKDVVVLADFSNATGETVFDLTLRQALSIALEESPFLEIMDDQRMREELRFMGRDGSARISDQIAREICQRDNEKAVLSGSIASLGTGYVISVSAVNCQTGAVLARAQAEARDREHVLQAVSNSAARIRERLGESLASVQKRETPLEQETTSSLEALQAYTLAVAQRNQGAPLAAIPLLQRATALDPNFASAWLEMSHTYASLGDEQQRAETLKTAFRLRNRVSEREQLTISSTYYVVVSGELNKAAESLQLLIAIYPRVSAAHNILGGVYLQTGEFQKAVEEFQQAVRLTPRVHVFEARLIFGYILTGQLIEAKTLSIHVLDQNIADSLIRGQLLSIAYLEDDSLSAQKQLQWAVGKLLEYQLLRIEALNEDCHGRRRSAKALLRRATDMALMKGLRNPAFRLVGQDALSDAFTGNCSEARLHARSAISPNAVPVDAFPPLLALSICGDGTSALEQADRLTKSFPAHLIWNSVYSPAIHAAVAVKSGRPGDATELLRSATPYLQAYPEVGYLRGLALFLAGQAKNSIVEFQSVLDHRSAHWGPFYALSLLGRARASAMIGDSANARKSFQDLLELWKDADPDLPVLQNARKENAALN